MCQNPSYIRKAESPLPSKIPVPCRKCWQCKSNRVNDFVGRALCEASTSDWVLTLTLTYRPQDDLSDKVLTPRHFQNFIKLLRVSCPKTRYLVCGEYGELRGRAHFHVILFGKGKKPEIPNKINTHIHEWPHGHVFADWSADEAALRYVCKYLLKEDGKQSWHSLSKKPSLGAEFFARRARRYVELGTMPSSFEYLPPGGSSKRPYLLTGATRRDFLNALVQGWEENRPLERAMLSEWVLKVLERHELAARIEEAYNRPMSEQLAGFFQELEQRRLTERQVNNVMLDTAPNSWATRQLEEKIHGTEKNRNS
jgi:hypothetical protein